MTRDELLRRASKQLRRYSVADPMADEIDAALNGVTFVTDEPSGKPDAAFMEAVGFCSNCACEDCREFFKSVLAAQNREVKP